MKSVFAALIALVGFSSWAMVQNLSAKGGSVEFLAIGKPSFIRIHGVGSSATGQIAVENEKAQGKFAFDLGSLNTGIETRNEHMKTKYLETPKYPKAELEVTGTSALKDWTPQNPKIAEAEFDGMLTLHGVTKPIKGNFSVSGSGAADIHFKVKLSDYAVSVPVFAGITVADEVEITVKIDKLEQ